MAKEGSIYRKGDYEYQVRGGKAYNFNIQKPEKKVTPVKPKPKPKPKVKPEPEKPEFKMPKRPVSQTPGSATFNPLTSTSVNVDGTVKSGAEAVRAKDFGDVSKLPEKPEGKRFNPLTSTYYKDGGKVRGDGMSRVKTKGRCL